MTGVKNCIIVGAGGRDFHNFLTFFRRRPDFRVCAFTAAQIPFSQQRTFPRALAGPNYAEDIPIFPVARLPELITRFDAAYVFLAYSDLPHEQVMHQASITASSGASFVMLGPRHTQLTSSLPVIAVTAVRSGAGKSSIAHSIGRHLGNTGRRVGILRHPMPYGVLERQVSQRFSTWDDLDQAECTLEEREEYTPYLELGLTVFSGVDYRMILEQAERESDVILWDGGNNDFSFVRPDLSIVVLDALRPGHELRYYPGESNLRSADIAVINKVSGAQPGVVEAMRRTIGELNPRALVLETDLQLDVEEPARIPHKRVLVIEDGPAITRGGLPHGAGYVAARKYEAGEIVDPRPFALGTIADAYHDHPHIGPVLPALGYTSEQRLELAAMIELIAPELVIDASPAGVAALLALEEPSLRVRYRMEQRQGPPLLELAEDWAASAVPRGRSERL